MNDLSVIIPVRNVAGLIVECLDSVVAADPREIIVVDGRSTDETLSILERYPVTVLSDEGRGLPVARRLGAEAAASDRVLLLDADVVVPHGAIEALLEEFESEGYQALQAGLHSVGGPGFWGDALAEHHRTGRSRNWFGVVATIFETKVLLEHGFDDSFISGEDIELRWRLRDAGAKVGVSTNVEVIHRFADDSFAFAQDQFLMDGEGLGRMIKQRGVRGAPLAFLPIAAAIRGVALTLARRRPQYVRYYLRYAYDNYVGMVTMLRGEPSRTITLADGAVG